MKRRHATIALLMSLNLNHAYAVDPHAHHAPSPDRDNRVVLKLSPGERVMILQEMRLFLDGVQKMTGALGKQDMQATAAAARSMGQIMVHELPPALRDKLPMEFRQLGSTVHRDFDQMAMNAESLQDVSVTLNQLSGTLKLCVSCHATYQIQTPAFNNKH